MPKLVVWNLEWLDDLFLPSRDGLGWRSDDYTGFRGPGKTLAQRVQRIADGIKHLDPDILVIVEGPHRQGEFDLFIERCCEGSWDTWLQHTQSPASPAPGARVNTSLQAVGIAVRTDRGAFADPALTPQDAMDPTTPIGAATEPFFFDTGADKVTEWYRYFRRPAYATVHLADGRDVNLMGLHLKSKGIFSAYEWSRWWQMADANRERLLAECRHLREAFLDPYLTDPATKDTPLIVCGDINDGPGFDTSELRLKASGIETLMGSIWKPDLTLGNALFDRLSDRNKARMQFDENTTTRFQDPIFNGQYHHVWIDHILYSRNVGAPWITGGDVIRTMPDADGDPHGFKLYKISDHYPVVADITLPAIA